MTVVVRCLRGLEAFNDWMLAFGRQLAWVLVALMVLTILLQVVRRYVMNDALPWPEEVARAFMIWMVALVAGTGLRSGAFVAIDLLGPALPRAAGRVLNLVLLLAATALLVQLFALSIEFFERGFRTRAASFALSRAWIYLAMPVCFGSMLLVSIELALREACRLLGDEAEFPDPADPLRAPPQPARAGAPAADALVDTLVDAPGPGSAAPRVPAE